MPSARILTILAFAAIYVLWGSTYLAIRVAVQSTPPLLAAGIRFFLAGAALYGWARARGGAKPSRLEWRSLAIEGALLFLIAYSGLFWAEKTLPSGIASVLVATIPVWTALLQIFILRKESFGWSLAVSILLGLGGVAMLAFDPTAGVSPLACWVLLGSTISWSSGTVLSKVLPLPKSMPINSGAQMVLGGGMLLVCSALLGEWQPLPHISWRAAWAILYLIVAGSIIAFTAYVWLLQKMPVTVVTSYAYVNPVVALLLGYWLGSEPLGLRTLLGAALILLSVVIVLRQRKAH